MDGKLISFILDPAICETPAFVYDENAISNSLNIIEKVRSDVDIKILYSVKALSIVDAIRFISSRVDGFSTSSIFEARLVKSFAKRETSIHLTTPNIRDNHIGKIAELCNYISFNSLTQWKLYCNKFEGKISLGLRINPELSFVSDDRYNPCRNHSKLGVPLHRLINRHEHENGLLDRIQGIHFHTNCESKDFTQLLLTVRHIDQHLSWLFGRVRWVNIGGGYLADDSSDLHNFVDTVSFLKNRYDVEVFYEPGKGIIGQAGSIVSTVVDIFVNGRDSIAVLDTTTNHMPEVFEYQYKPDVAQESEEGKYSYILAGTTCLAGDVFGEYRFDEPLEIGSRIVFENMGAYTLVKANMFNGINLPTIYAYTQDGKIEMKRQFTYDDFLSRCGSRQR
jgi:carboxynorspermidine decarboxylase